MSKGKLREKRTTKLIVGEGMSEMLFLARLKQLYYTRGQNYMVTVDNAGGGDPTSVVRFIMHYSGAFDERYMLIDSDRPISQKCIKEAKAGNIKIIQSSPHCLEGMLLCSLGIKRTVLNTAAAKATFYPNICAGESLNERWCQENIIKEMIDRTLLDLTHPYQDFYNSLVNVMKK